jgi:RHS repeat-associated protein
MKRASLFLLFLCAFPAGTILAQVQTGTPSFGTFGGGPEEIDLANLNVHIVVPVVSRPGRGGLNFSYTMTYDSSVWETVPAGSNKAWEPPATNWGWQGVNSLSPAEIVMNSTIPSPCFANGILGGQTGEKTSYGWSYLDPNATVHIFGTTWVVQGNCPGFTTTSIDATAIDGSGYTLAANGSSFVSLQDRYGNSLFPPINGQGQSSGPLIQDRNGNQISFSGSAYIDTLGTTVLSTSGTAPNPVTFTYTAPSGASATYTVRYSPYTVQTNFGCSGINEYGPTSQNLVSEIDLPDDNPNGTRDRYTFTYETTPGFSGSVTGRLASVTLPTGGTITYSYSGGTGTNNSGIVCADGSTATLTRSTPDTGSNNWKYAHSESGSAWITTVTDPQENQTVYDFQGIYQTERTVYQGTSTQLENDATCYNGNTSNCTSTAVALPISEMVVTKALGSRQCQHAYFYNSNGLPTEQDDYDYGNGAPGVLLRKQLTLYDTTLGNNILGAPLQVTIENGSGTIIAETSYGYDETSVVTTQSTPQHASVTGSRGNVTTIGYTVGNGHPTLAKRYTYFDTGNVATATDVNGSQSTVTYNYSNATATCGNAFPSSVSEPLSLSKSMVWNCTGSVETSATDENGQTASTAYTDPNFWRPANVTDQESNTTNFTYASPNSTESSLLFNSNSSTVDVLATFDGLGRTLVAQKKQSPSATSYDSAETNYDTLGRPSGATVPYSGTSGQTNSSSPATTQTYDALNRPLITTDGGGGTVTLSYSANDVLQTIGPKVGSENLKQRQMEYNSIGQLTSVCEITAGTTSAPAGTCGQTTSATGYWTKYTYDVLGDLLTVTQNAQSSSTQSRTYSYDGLGRMLSEKNPETGTTAIAYVYDTDSTCGTSDGDLVKRTDAAGNVTCYAYDALHRETSITYPSGPNSGNTPGKFFVYDSATVDGNAMANAASRLAEAYTCTGSCSTKITDEGFSYTVRGELRVFYESTPHSGGYFWVGETYWPNGAVSAVNNNLATLPDFTYGVDGEGRVNTVSANTGQNPVTATVYNVASETTQVTFGSTDFDVFGFDANTFRMTQYRFNVNGQNVTGTLTWNANGTLGKLNITDPFNTTNTQQCIYSHDDLARLASANCGSVWSQTFTYDAFGNITKAGTNSFNPGYNSNNQMATGATYDSNGDVLTDSLHSYAWDSLGRPTTIDTVTATYDALGRIVEQSKSGMNTEMVYDCAGNKLALMNTTTTLVTGFGPLPAGATAVYNASGLQYYRHPDWLGSSRFSSTPTRTMYNDLAYAPFGEQYAQAGSTGITNTSFAGNNQDTSTNLYDAQHREYEVYGRWPSPDQAGFSTANPANPQSWNRYAYVSNSPLRSVDPTGLHVGCYPLMAGGGCYTDDGFNDGGEATLDGIDIPDFLAAELLQGGAAAICPYNSCTAVNSKTGQIGYAWASVNGPAMYYAYYGPGALYYDAQSAAAAAFAYVFGTYSNAQGPGVAYEYGGDIYTDANGVYSYTNPIWTQVGGCTIDTTCTFNGNVVNLPAGTDSAGDYHTHPFGGDFTLPDDYYGALATGFPSFLGQPSGCNEYYYPPANVPSNFRALSPTDFAQILGSNFGSFGVCQ